MSAANAACVRDGFLVGLGENRLKEDERMKRAAAAFGSLKFRNKMVLSTLLVALIPLLMLSVVVATVLVQDVRDQSGQMTLQLVGQTSESLDIYINTIEKLMDLVISRGSAGPGSSREQATQRMADAILQSYPEIAGFCIAYEDEQYFGAGMSRVSRDRFEDEYWWQYAIDRQGQLGVVGSVVGRNVLSNLNDSSDSIFALVKSFSYGTGQRGVVMFDIRHDMIEQLINRVSIGEEGFLFVVDDSDVVFTPSSGIVYRIDQESYQREGAATDTVKINGTGYFIANQYSGYSGWRVVGVVPESEFSASVRPVYQALSVCIIVCLVLVVLVSLGVSATVTRPISKLSRLMAKAEEGDFSVRFESMHQDEIGVLGSSFNHMLEHIGELIHELYEEKQIRLEAQLKSLQEQIKPHFLYNTLDTISWMARAQNAMDVVRLVDALTNMFRVGLSSGRDYITLREEKNHVTNYLYIQKVRYQDRLRYAIEIPDEYDGLVVPKLILQPLVENAIYHGVKMKRSGGQIRVTAQTEGDMLLLRVWDDGAGISPERLEELRQGKSRLKEEKTGGFGLSYIAERIELSYGAPYGIQIDSQEGIYTQVTICLPIEEEGSHV